VGYNFSADVFIRIAVLPSMSAKSCEIPIKFEVIAVHGHPL